MRAEIPERVGQRAARPEPIVVQHTRLDGRTADIALMTSSAYGE
jgi:hypothetical protein